MGLGQNFWTQVGSAIYGLGLENFPYKFQNFSIFFSSDWVEKYSGQRQALASFLMRVKSMLGPGQGPL